MASVMAIVSKAIFEKMLGKKKPALGDLLDTNEYVSKNARLDAVSKGGGAMFLVTVRPPDESLWLVAVLESPKLTKTGWVAASNVVPMTDIGALKSKLVFDTGTGIQAKPGALGMSLQTPRILTDSDVAVLRDALGAKPAASGKPSRKVASVSGVEASRWRAPRTHSEALGESYGSSLSDVQRERMIRAVERASGGRVHYARSHVYSQGKSALPTFVHRGTGVLMQLVVGGETDVGFTARDREKLTELLATSADREVFETLVQSGVMEPSKRVSIAPYLLAQRPLTSEQITGLLTGESPDLRAARAYASQPLASLARAVVQAPVKGVSAARVSVIEEALRTTGLRLPSETEWECAARAGTGRLTVQGDAMALWDAPWGLNPWGLARMGEVAELCGDAWHPSHEGKRPEVGTQRVARGGMQRSEKGDRVWRYGLCAARRAHTDVQGELALRPALSLTFA